MKYLLSFLLVLVISGLVAGVVYLYLQYDDSQKEIEKLKDPSYYSQVQGSIEDATLEKLSELIILPEEKPTMATVIKAEELKKTNPSFYENIQNGDQIIMYSDLLIVYRQSEDKIVTASYLPANTDLDQTTDGGNTETSNE